jgi:DNA mismatch repair protein MutS
MAVEASPMLEQYRRLKAEHPGTILFFRMGDFYETFFEDAVVASKVLGITLTSRDRNKADSVPLAGVPHHAVEGYLRTLVASGLSVAIAEQMEPAEQAKGLLDRQIVEVLTPGTLTRSGLLDARESNYILALLPEAGRMGVAVAEVSTGEFRVGEIAREDLATLLLEYPAREVLLPLEGRAPAAEPAVTLPPGVSVARLDPERFDVRGGRSSLERRFQVLRLDAFGLADQTVGLGAAGALLQYLQELKKSDLPQVREVRPLREGAPLVVDEVTLRNLEVLESAAGPEYTLLHLLDRTETAMGARALRALLRTPSRNRALLEARLDRTQAFAASAPLRGEARERLHRYPDLERALGLLGSGRASPRDLGAVRDALRRLPGLVQMLDRHRGAVTAAWREALPDLGALERELAAALSDELPLLATQGGIIREGYDPELDRLRRDAADARGLILALEASERERTGISNLKVGYNRVFGYHIEVTRSQLSRVPADYVRRQTLTQAERFVTPDLKRMEERIEAAASESQRLETAHFQALRQRATAAMGDLHAAARVLAELDLHLALGEAAARGRWTRPVLTDGLELDLRGARHPMVESALPPGAFVPNDAVLDPAREQIWLITGPNMGGKSTFLRQVGLCVFLAQVGSFLPAKSARIGLVDRIFTRVGASDQIARGASTFFVEMEETAVILNQATDRSLVLLDEVGRGTSTYDGLSLAWAVTEILHDGPRARPRTFFATHYHELTDLEEKLPRLRNRNVRVAEEGHEIVFLHTIAAGRADRSYGIHVAHLAGVPEAVLRRAREILGRLEKEHARPVATTTQLALAPAADGAGGSATAPGGDASAAPAAPGADRLEALRLEVAETPVETLTPLDALNELARLRDRARSVEER